MNPRQFDTVDIHATGGTCDVSRAIDAVTGQIVALKQLLPRWNEHPTMIARLRNEAELIGPVRHPNVCRIFEYAVFEGRHTLVMDFIDGPSLAARLAREGALPLDRARRLGREICEGVAALHAAGVLHRDLKPENVLIAPGDGRDAHPTLLHVTHGLAKLIDFGSAERIGAPPTPGASIGTPAYMAPEQLASGETSAASDVYSLGLVLVELLTGRRYDPTATRVELDGKRRDMVNEIIRATLAMEPARRIGIEGLLGSL